MTLTTGWAKHFDQTLDPPPVETRWWLLFRAATRSIPLLASLIPVSLSMAPVVSWSLLALLTIAATVQGSWFTLRGRSRLGKGLNRAFGAYTGLVMVGTLIYMLLLVDERETALPSSSTMFILIALYTYTWLVEKMQVKDTGKPVRPGSLTVSAPAVAPAQSPAATSPRPSRKCGLLLLALALMLGAVRRRS